MGDYCQVEFVLMFDCPESIMEQRLLKRGETSGRSDDNIESIRKRFQTYIESTIPVIQHYEHQGKVHKIDATQPIEQVYQHVQRVITAQQW